MSILKLNLNYPEYLVCLEKDQLLQRGLAIQTLTVEGELGSPVAICVRMMRASCH